MKSRQPVLNSNESHAMTVIEIRPHRLGWKVFEAPGAEPVFPEKTSSNQLRGESRVLSLRRDSHTRFERQRRARDSVQRHESKAVRL
jgi:hypothetical protein